MYVHAYVSIWAYVCPCAQKGQKMMLGLLELQLQPFVEYLAWYVGARIWGSGPHDYIASSLNHWVILRALLFHLKNTNMTLTQEVSLQYKLGCLGLSYCSLWYFWKIFFFSEQMSVVEVNLVCWYCVLIGKSLCPLGFYISLGTE